MPTIDEHMSMHGSKQTDHTHRTACRRFSFIESFIARREQMESRRVTQQAAPDDRLIQPRDVLRELLESLRRMEVQEQSEISAMHVEIHQRRRLPLAHLLHRSRKVGNHGARTHTAPCADHADDSPRLHLRAGHSPGEPLLEPC